jgi:hypothetical protein
MEIAMNIKSTAKSIGCGIPGRKYAITPAKQSVLTEDTTSNTGRFQGFSGRGRENPIEATDLQYPQGVLAWRIQCGLTT